MQYTTRYLSSGGVMNYDAVPAGEDVRVLNLPFTVYVVRCLVHGPIVRTWCGLPYPGHPTGCPNVGNPEKAKCPPIAPYITEVLDITKPIYFVCSDYDLAAHVTRMREAHPDWSDRALRNVLYWQGTSRAQAAERAERASAALRCNFIERCAEGKGVNLYATCRLAGLRLRRIATLTICHHVILLGTGRI